jgi:hypothetical protein
MAIPVLITPEGETTAELLERSEEIVEDQESAVQTRFVEFKNSFTQLFSALVNKFDQLIAINEKILESSNKSLKIENQSLNIDKEERRQNLEAGIEGARSSGDIDDTGSGINQSKSIAERFGDILKGIGPNIFDKILLGLATFLAGKTLLEYIREKNPALFDEIVDPFLNLSKAVVKFGQETVMPIYENFFKPLISGMFDLTTGTLQTIYGLVTADPETIEKGVKTISSGITYLIDTILNAFIGIVNLIPGIDIEMNQFRKRLLKVDEFIEKNKNAVDDAVEAVDEFKGEILKDAVNKNKETIISKFADFFNGIGDFVTRLRLDPEEFIELNFNPNSQAFKNVRRVSQIEQKIEQGISTSELGKTSSPIKLDKEFEELPQEEKDKINKRAIEIMTLKFNDLFPDRADEFKNILDNINLEQGQLNVSAKDINLKLENDTITANLEKPLKTIGAELEAASSEIAKQIMVLSQDNRNNQTIVNNVSSKQDTYEGDVITSNPDLFNRRGFSVS